MDQSYISDDEEKQDHYKEGLRKRRQKVFAGKTSRFLTTLQ